MLKVSTDVKLDFADVLIRPRRSELKSRSEVKLARSFTAFKHGNIGEQPFEVVPIMASNMDSVTGWQMCRALAEHKMMAAVPKHYTPTDWLQFASELGDKRTEVLKHLAVTAGTSSDDLAKLREIFGGELGDELHLVCLDVANGYSTAFSDVVRRVREEMPKKVIMAGNVVTADMVEQLLLDGADIVKIGIGPGSVCQTRLKTGIGYPQLSAVQECADAARVHQGMICSDGGCINPGDVAKAFGAGADFVMVGGMLAGHDECPGELIQKEGKKFKLFYGMASKTAQQKHQGGLAEYRASEGKTVLIPHRGSVDDTIKDLLGGLRSTCTYTGCHELAQLAQNVSFIRVNNQQQLNISLTKYDTGN